MNDTPHSTYTGYGGGGGGGGVYKHEAPTVNYDDSMTINVDGGARGERKREDCPHAGGIHDSDCDYWVTQYRGFAGSAGEVFFVSRLYVLVLIVIVDTSFNFNPRMGYPAPLMESQQPSVPSFEKHQPPPPLAPQVLYASPYRSREKESTPRALPP